MDLDLQTILDVASVWVLPILMAVTLHEAAHGWVAWKLGDNTAKLAGRVSFNPLKHIDPFGTILLPAMLLLFSGGKMAFGFAKPVPVNFMALNNPRRDMVLVAAAGPGTNFVLSYASALMLHGVHWLPDAMVPWAAQTLLISMYINVILAIFNLIPLPPLDGGRIAVGLLPAPLAIRLQRLERGGFLIIIFALFILPWIGGKLGVDLNVLWWLIGVPAEHITNFIAAMAGLN